MSADQDMERAVLWKVTLRLIPFLFVLYVLNILDRVNVGFARLEGSSPGMLTDLHLSETVYAWGSGIFYIGYFLFEVPSNLMLHRTGARRWIARILISWGLISSTMMFISSAWQFYLLRILLGIAEAGFFPGIILYLSYWFPARQRARAVSRFMTGSAVTGMLFGPVSGAIKDHMHGVAGLAGWQWLFLIEGLPAAIMGFVTLWYLTDRPQQAEWLPEEERRWLADRLAGEERHRQQHHSADLLTALARPRVWLLCLLYFTVASGATSYGFYAPTLIQKAFPAFSDSQIGWLVAVPATAAMIAMILIGSHSDHTGERRWHVGGPAFVAACGWLLAALSEEPLLVLLGLVFAQAGMLSMLAPFWALATSFLSGAAAAGSIALINSVGNLGGFVAPIIIGRFKEETGAFTGGTLFLAGILAAGGILAVNLYHDATLERAPAEPNPEGKNLLTTSTRTNS